MIIDKQKPKLNKQQKFDPFSWLLWTVVSIILFAILIFTISTLLILKSQGITQGTTTLTIISIVIGVIIGLLGLLFAFLQWFHPRPSRIHEGVVDSSEPELSRTIVRFPASVTDVQESPDQAVQSNDIEVSSIADKTINGINSITSEEKNKQHEDWGEAPNVDVFYGREEDLNTLETWIITDRCRLVGLLGMGGIGKTACATKLAQRIQKQFDYIMWRSLRNAPSIEDILGECILFLSNNQVNDLPETINRRLPLLINYLRKYRCLLVFDNAEAILRSNDQAGQYRDGFEGYGSLFQSIGESTHQSCLVLTSREKPREIALLESAVMPVRSYRLTGLTLIEGQAILKEKGLYGTNEAWTDLNDHYAGNPLALKLVSETILEVFGGDIASFLKEGEVIFHDVRSILDQQFDRLSELEKEVMYWLAIEREGVLPSDLQDNIIHPVSKGELQESLKSLRRRNLIEKNGTGFSLQNVVMEYMTERLVTGICEEITTGEISLYSNHTLIKAQAKDYIRESQVHLVLKPIVKQLLSTLGKEGIEKKLKKILSSLRKIRPQRPSYTAGNSLNLLVQLQTNLRSYDFSHLIVWQAYLQGIALSDVNFSFANLARSVFTETFGSILSVALSPNCELLAASTANGEVMLWQVNNGTLLLTCLGHTDWVRSVAFSPDGKLLASGSDDQTIRLWELSTGHILGSFEGHTNRIWSVAFSPDGKLLVSGSEDQTVRLWEVSTGRCLSVLQEHTNRTYSVAFSPDGKLLVSGSEDQTVRLWEVSTGRCLSVLQEHTNWVWSVAFSPDGKLLASGSEDRTIRLWEVSTGRCLRTLQGHANRVWSVDFSRDGKLLVSGSEDQTVRLWEVSTGRCLRTLGGHTNRVWSVAFSPDGNLLASGNDDQTIRLWEASTGRYLRMLCGHSNRVGSIAFSPDGKLLVSGSEDQTVRLWEVSTGRCLRTLGGHTNWVRSVAFSPDGNLLASGNDDQTIRLWEASTGRCLRILQSNSRIFTVAFSPDGSLLASGNEDQTVRLWEVSTGHCLRTLGDHTNRVWSVAFSPDGNLLASGSEDRTIRLWEVSTGRCLRTLGEHSDLVRSVAFSTDGKLLTSGSHDQTICLWEVSTGRCLRTLGGHTNRIWSVAFSPDGNLLASGSTDGTIKLWDVQKVVCLITLRSDRPYERMNITGVNGLTYAQKATLKTLGAIDDEELPNKYSPTLEV